MKAFNFLLVSFMILLSVNISGQTATGDQSGQPYIEVTGTAEKEVIPDEIFIGITIQEKYVNRVKITIEEQEEKLKLLIQSLRIDFTNLSVSDADADFVRVSWQKKDVLTKKNYSLKVPDATTVSKVFQGLNELEIADARIDKVRYSKIDSLRKETRILAIKAAKDKADYMLAAIGEETGKALVVKEEATLQSSNNINVRGQRSTGSVFYVDGVKADTYEENELQFEKIKVQISIYVKFGIQ
ncbi:MAG: SIMPL domain-containing protein [Bacteroidales bacterium]|nr:SIMPL domain-containing protein [Bacteroidales bacterium]